ncbi:MAG: hypothetical protein Q8P49_03620 [Candidatus Liptonbacteria bacterium]|nr:hypothetical protein [Candidatus Liptonbacteria bacterium]
MAENFDAFEQQGDREKRKEEFKQAYIDYLNTYRSIEAREIKSSQAIGVPYEGQKSWPQNDREWQSRAVAKLNEVMQNLSFGEKEFDAILKEVDAQIIQYDSAYNPIRKE